MATVFVEGKGQISTYIESLDATIKISQDRVVGEISSILASPLVFLPSLDHLIRSREHVRWNRHADLLGGLQIDHELKLLRLFHREIGWLGTLQDFVHVTWRPAASYQRCPPHSS